MPQNSEAKNPKYHKYNIAEVMLIGMSDATGGTKYAIIGAVVYLRYTYKDHSYGWQMVAACSEIAPEMMTIVVRELKALKMAVYLAKRVGAA